MVSQFNVLILVKPYFIFFYLTRLLAIITFPIRQIYIYISIVELHDKFIHVLSQYEIYHIT